jgi:hypothetical protein
VGNVYKSIELISQRVSDPKKSRIQTPIKDNETFLRIANSAPACQAAPDAHTILRKCHLLVAAV